MSKEANSGLAAVKSESKTYPYPPSWLDRFTGWVERLPGRSWVFYPALGLVLAFVVTVVQWRAGSYPIGTFDAFHVWFAIQIPYFLALIRYLDGAAEAALRNFRPALNVSEAEYAELRYRLTTAPARPTLLGSLAGVTVAVLILPMVPHYLSLLGWSTLPPALVIAYGLFFLMMWVVGALVYHTMHQLRLVSHIYATQAIVNLFDLSPLYAFSSFTSQTAVGLIIFNYLWFATAPDLLYQPLGIGFGVFYAVVAAVTFLWPLLGIHRRLVEEKQRLLRECSQRLAATIAELHGRVDAGELLSMDELHDTMAGLEIEWSALTRIPTWPWQPETLRGFITALLLPAVVFLLQFVLQRAFGQ
jgi:predicted secreted protein